MKVRIKLSAWGCVSIPAVPVRWWITVIVVILVVPAQAWDDALRLLLH